MEVEKTEKKGIAILGATGSIGVQSLQVISEFPERFQVEVLTANHNFNLLIAQAKKFKPNAVVIANEDYYKQVEAELWNYGIKTFCGEEAIEQVLEMEDIHIVLNAIVGFAGLKPSYAAIKSGKILALANKESMVVAGDFLMRLAVEKQVPIIPIDSELSAVFQSCMGEAFNRIEKIYLTASGGPFLKFHAAEIENASLEDALKHPNYSMGDKISIDSANMMNKGFEAIEAQHLFHLKAEQIDIIVQPQSVVHSIVQFEDGSMKAHFGLPDMSSYIAYALSFPERLPLKTKRFDFLNFPKLDFEKPDLQKFPNISIAYEAMKMGGNAGAILNAANEAGNSAFRKAEISFMDITKLNALSLSENRHIKDPLWEDYLQTDRDVRKWAKEKLESFQ